MTAFKEATGIDIPIRLVGRRDGDVSSSVANVEKAKKLINFGCENNLLDMCIDAWNWKKRNPRGFSH